MPPSPKQVLKQIIGIENRIVVVREYARLWQQFGGFFIDGFPPERVISPEEEQGFFQLLNIIAINHYRFTELASPHFKEGDDILAVLASAVSLDTMRNMSEAQFGQLCTDWHRILIMMNKTIGKLLPLLPVQKAK
jgi:hypothetical protein